MASTMSRQQVPFTYVRSAPVPPDPETVDTPAPVIATRRAILFCAVATLVFMGVHIAVAAFTGNTEWIAVEAAILVAVLAGYAGTFAMSTSTPVLAGVLAIVVTLLWVAAPFAVPGLVLPNEILITAALLGALLQGIASDFRTRRINDLGDLR
jgi:hypothetical protein